MYPVVVMGPEMRQVLSGLERKIGTNSNHNPTMVGYVIFG